MNKTTIQLAQEVKAVLDNKRFGLISKSINEFVQIIMKKENPTEEMLEDINDKALIAVNYIFNGTTTVEKRIEDNKVYYKFCTDGTMIFEYGLQEDSEDSDSNE